MLAPHAGLLLPLRRAGESVAAGDAVAALIDPLAPPGTPRHALCTRTAGVIFAQLPPGPVAPGDRIAKIAGAQPLADRAGTLLGD